MQQFISMMNVQSFYYLWKNDDARKYLIKIINNILNQDYDYTLLSEYEGNSLYVRNYIFLNHNNDIVFIDFNNQKNKVKENLDMELVKSFKIFNKQNIILIIFNNFDGIITNEDGIINIYKNDQNSQEVKLFMSSDYDEQQSYNNKKILKYLYSSDQNFIKRYLNEYKIEENIYKIFKV